MPKPSVAVLLSAVVMLSIVTACDGGAAFLGGLGGGRNYALEAIQERRAREAEAQRINQRQQQASQRQAAPRQQPTRAAAPPPRQQSLARSDLPRDAQIALVWLEDLVVGWSVADVRAACANAGGIFSRHPNPANGVPGSSDIFSCMPTNDAEDLTAGRAVERVIVTARADGWVDSMRVLLGTQDQQKMSTYLRIALARWRALGGDPVLESDPTGTTDAYRWRIPLTQPYSAMWQGRTVVVSYVDVAVEFERDNSRGFPIEVLRVIALVAE